MSITAFHKKNIYTKNCVFGKIGENVADCDGASRRFWLVLVLPRHLIG